MICPEAWCCSFYQFHIDWCQRWIWVKIKTTMLFLYEHILDTGWTFCGDIISFLNTIVECYHIECSLSPMRPVCYITPTMEICFQSSLSNGFEAICENPLQVPEYLQPYISYILSNTNSSCTQLKLLSSWSKITSFMFPYITSSVECISKFLNARRKRFEERKPFDSSSSLNVRWCKLWFGNIFIMLMCDLHRSLMW